MITATYGLSGILLAATGWMFQHNLLTATTQTICWTAIFFIASCAANSAYLAVSEVFPLETVRWPLRFFMLRGRWPAVSLRLPF